jgi:hypothetical protein
MKRHSLLVCRAATVAILALCALTFGAYDRTACAMVQKSGAKMVNHAFSFGGMGIPENPGIEILNFQYGDSKVPGTYEEEGRLATGHIGQSGLVRGTMPVGDFLYVKWRILATSDVLEDRVDLKSRLPDDMDHKIIHFSITGHQLIVSLIEGIEQTDFHANGAPDCPVPSYRLYKCTRIYPDHWANF